MLLPENTSITTSGAPQSSASTGSEQCLSITAYQSLHRTLVRLCQKSLQLPDRMYVEGVRVNDPDDFVKGGSYGDILKGHYHAQPVALKCIRKLRHYQHKEQSRKVSCSL